MQMPSSNKLILIMKIAVSCFDAELGPPVNTINVNRYVKTVKIEIELKLTEREIPCSVS